MFSSLAFTPAWPASAWSRLPLVAGLAVREAIASTCEVSTGLRWPNDLVVDEGKVGGILVEAADDRVVVGCGVNLVWATPVEGGAALYSDESAEPSSRRLASAWVEAFINRTARDPREWGADEYRSACTTIGRPVAYASGSGTAIGISPDGALLVDTSDGVVEVQSGEVRLHEATSLPTERRGI
jgi:BirA family biotin operon repressor/biotin-[acetyl-CoA-carboxylase] ligase